MRSWVSAPPLGSERSEVTPSQQFPDGIYAGQLTPTWTEGHRQMAFFCPKCKQTPSDADEFAFKQL